MIGFRRRSRVDRSSSVCICFVFVLFLSSELLSLVGAEVGSETDMDSKLCVGRGVTIGGCYSAGTFTSDRLGGFCLLATFFSDQLELAHP